MNRPLIAATAPRPILIVEADQDQQRILAESLGLGNEFDISLATTLTDADRLLATEDARFDAIILDPGTSDGDSYLYLAKLRRQGCNMPIIIVTDLSDDADVVAAFDAGANDYLTKPVRPIELLARLRAQLRIFDNSEDATFTIGHYSFRPAARLLCDQAKRRLRLTNKETQILKFLYRAGPTAVNRANLLEGVWGYNSGVTTHTLETHIYRLRQKMEVNPGDSRILLTEVGGYRLNAALAA